MSRDNDFAPSPSDGSAAGKPLPDVEWRKRYGDPLLNALRWIAHWRLEARSEEPRELTYQEFEFRARGYLSFDGKLYQMVEGLPETVATMATPGLLRSTSNTEMDTDFGPVPRLNYELAQHIMRTNLSAGVALPKLLQAFSDDNAPDLRRPRGRDQEEKRLFRTLAWWGVDRGVNLGLRVTVNRSPAPRRAAKTQKTAVELVFDMFQRAGLGNNFTRNSIVAAWEAHRHQGANDRKLAERANTAVYRRRFEEMDKLLRMLPPFPED